MTKENLILFTVSYPFGNDSETAFLNNELKHLTPRFGRIFLIPSVFNDNNDNYDGNFIVDISLAKMMSASRCRDDIIRASIISPVFWKELFLLIKSKRFSFSRIKAMFRVLDDAIRIEMWIYNFITNHCIDINESVFYTYWLWKSTLGVGLAKKKYPNIELISRAHGFDLYEKRNSLSYIPYRFETLDGLNKLYLISEHGMKYISEYYPEFLSKYIVARLGVKRADILNQSSKDGKFRIVSCAYVKDVKRVDLILSSIEKLAKSHLLEDFHWVHFGDGPMLQEVKRLAENLPPNVKYIFQGNVTNKEILEYYQRYPVDVFLSLSRSEGIPMSIMEAQSYGIPVVATSVGGVPEIVNSKNGFLLEADPSPDVVAEVIWKLTTNSENVMELRINARETWAKFFNAEKNFEEFANNILSTL